jgi:hypothetical protein
VPVPEVLRTLSNDPAFWAEWFNGGHPDEPDPVELRVTFPVSHGFGLVLDIDRFYGTFGLGLRTPITIEPILRWPEVDLIGRVTALDDPSLPHPGLPVVLLSRFAPITPEDDAGAVRALLGAALRSFRVPAPPLEQEPLFPDAGEPWPVLSEDQVAEYLAVTQRDLRTLRVTDNEQFPFEELAELMRLAERRISRLRGEPWYTDRVAAAARASDLSALLAALDAAGCDHPTIVDALTPPVVPAEAAWVVEVLGGAVPVPLGRR